MKILAIRGCNLASLAGEFEIDLCKPPFTDQGVFAIVGNTGAGKSTLLDALCVALYDRTPRLSNHSRVIVGRGEDDPATLGAHDARTLLRRGAAAGFAEVDFEAADLKRYRARWSVRRARNQTDGTIQDQQISLVALDGSERLSGTKTETLKSIAARLGLSFDQFRRSALLAQNDFAAFLRADGRDRSELLERMTGTEIYSRLSIAAHLKATLAEQHLRDVRATAHAIAVLDDVARFEAATALGFAEDARRAARSRLEAAELAARWLAETATREAAHAAASADQAAAVEAMAGADALRIELAVRRRVEALRPLFEAVQQYGAVTDAIAALDRAIGTLDSDRAALVATRTLIAADHLAATTALADTQRKAQGFSSKRGVSLDAARKLEDEARARVTDAAQLAAIATRARGAIAARGELEARLAELAAAEARDRASEAEAVSAREQVTLLRAERTRVVDQLRAAAGYAHARTELVAGAPCPLCGAAEHPWRDRGTLDDVIVAAQAALDEAVAQLARTSGTLAAIVARAEQRALDRERLAGERTAAEQLATDSRTAWQTQLAASGELLLERDPSTPAAAQLAVERDAAARKQLEAARAARAQAEAVAKAAADAQAEVQLAQAAFDQGVARLADATRAIAELDTGAERLRGERDTRLAQRDEVAGTMQRVIARLAAGDAPPVDASSVPDLDDSSSGGELGDEPSDVPAARSRRPAIRGGSTRARRAGFDGRGRLRRFDELEARLRIACARPFEHVHELAAVRELLDELGAGSLFASNDVEIAKLIAELAALEAAVVRTAAFAGERAQLVIDHRASRPGEPELADAAVIEAVRATVAETEAQVARHAATIAADDDARRRRDEALAVLTADEARAEIDRILGAVIGSHDGKLFRSFAQSLTLDALLAVANAHLEDLAPRYQLERIPRHDLEIQVIDRDLGSEVRSVQSLSGGESFLVSLALALGLSSMSAQDVRVRTLLIDEGFGTLDPSALDGALGVLDALQATGRQIGVISHVPLLIERVGAHVKVVQRGGGRSSVVIAG